jgi:c-di-GMP-binding flagellar brake protein YcgR
MEPRASPGERRRYERVDFFCRLEVMLYPQGTAVEGHSLDLSLGGMRLITGNRLAVGQTIEVCFLLRERSSDVRERALGKVVRVEFDVGDQVAGVEFLDPLREQSHPRLIRGLLRR